MAVPQGARQSQTPLPTLPAPASTVVLVVALVEALTALATQSTTPALLPPTSTAPAAAVARHHRQPMPLPALQQQAWPVVAVAVVQC